MGANRPRGGGANMGIIPIAFLLTRPAQATTFWVKLGQKHWFSGCFVPMHCGALEAISRFFFSNSKKKLPVIRTHCVSIHTKFQLYSIRIE